MSYRGYVIGNFVKWIGILVIILTFMPLFSYNGRNEPAWAYLVDANWDRGLRLSNYTGDASGLKMSFAFYELIFGAILIVVGRLMTAPFRMNLGL